MLPSKPCDLILHITNPFSIWPSAYFTLSLSFLRKIKYVLIYLFILMLYFCALRCIFSVSVLSASSGSSSGSSSGFSSRLWLIVFGFLRSFCLHFIGFNCQSISEFLLLLLSTLSFVPRSPSLFLRLLSFFIYIPLLLDFFLLPDFFLSFDRHLIR